MTSLRPRFWDLPLGALNDAEWEALCDGCGKCCLHKVEDEDSGRIYFTNVRCRLLDAERACCMHYETRNSYVPDCVRLAPETVDDIVWLPRTCAYRLRNEGLPLPDWHYLICGDREAVHRAGESVRGWTVGESDELDLEDHLVEREI